MINYMAIEMKARQDWLTAHPGLTPLSFPCPHCGSSAGEQCRYVGLGYRHPHQVRGDQARSYNGQRDTWAWKYAEGAVMAARRQAAIQASIRERAGAR